jgi:hypothetical protein
MPRLRSTLICILGLAALAPAAASAATPATGPQPPDCPLWAARGAVEHQLTLPNGTKVVARDPYGGLLARNRLFFDFSLSKPNRGGAPAGVAQVSWALDGRVVTTDDQAPYEWKGLSSANRRITAGDHQITVSVTPAGGGAPVSTTFALTATDCQPASTFTTIGARESSLMAASAFESGEGPTMRSVGFIRSSGVSARIPGVSRGRAAGTLRLYPGGPRGRSYKLRVPRSGSTLLRHGSLRVVLHPGAKRFLDITGLPSGVKEALVTLDGAGGRLLRRLHNGTHTCRYGVDAAVAAASSKVRVDGGFSTYGC